VTLKLGQGQKILHMTHHLLLVNYAKLLQNKYTRKLLAGQEYDHGHTDTRTSRRTNQRTGAKLYATSPYSWRRHKMC
jgi:hypothetical protein